MPVKQQVGVVYAFIDCQHPSFLSLLLLLLFPTSLLAFRLLLLLGRLGLQRPRKQAVGRGMNISSSSSGCSALTVFYTVIQKLHSGRRQEQHGCNAVVLYCCCSVGILYCCCSSRRRY
jgi:hypothetical protein